MFNVAVNSARMARPILTIPASGLILRVPGHLIEPALNKSKPPRSSVEDLGGLFLFVVFLYGLLYHKRSL